MTAIPARALLLEDLPEVADWLTALLAQRFPGIHVDHAATLGEARRLLDSDIQPQLALVDLGLPDGDGTALIRPLAQRCPGCTIVVTTLFGDDAHVFPALRAGAHGYLLKDQPEERLAAALDGILRGEPPLSPAIAKRLLRAFQPMDPDPSPGAETLTARERDVLVLVAEGRSNRDIGRILSIGERTVQTHLGNILTKLDLESRTQAALWAVREGLVHP